MTKEGALLDCLATSYRLDLRGGEYIRRVCEDAVPILDRGLGVIAYTYDTAETGAPVIDHFATAGRLDPKWLPSYYAAVESSGLDRGKQRHPTGFRTWSHLLCGQASRVEGMKPFLPLFAHIGGSLDVFAINALDASGRGLWIGAPLQSTKPIPNTQVTLFTRFAAHLTSAVRLRRKPKPRTAALLSPNGKLLHKAATDDEVLEAREELRDATVAFEQARTKKMRADVDGATRRWRPLVYSRWSLLDEFDTDGRRFVVAVENGPPTRPPRRDLSVREHQVMTQAHLGHTDKVIAYELGLSVSTVRVLLHRATKKLGASTREEALARFAATTRPPR